MSSSSTMQAEDAGLIPFFRKIPLSIERGSGVYVWDEEGARYLDFTAGWGVTCLGHAHPVITEALAAQSRKIIQNPSSGLTYSPARARLLESLREVLPQNLTRVFFSNSGAEANDAAIKLARKVTGRTGVVSAHMSFHGRTISTASATGQARHREKFNPLMPHHRFIPFDDVPALEKALDREVAAVVLEPIQGEGGVRLPSEGYLDQVSALCRANGSLLVVDEVQTGFCRTGPFFVVAEQGVTPDFLTMAKGIAGGFPFGAFAVTEQVAGKIEIGDHGGTYCGNPLGCAVADAVIRYLLDHNIPGRVARLGAAALRRMGPWKDRFASVVTDVRGRGLLMAVEIAHEPAATRINDLCRRRGLLINQTQGTVLRLFPALTITEEELESGLQIMEGALGDSEEKE